MGKTRKKYNWNARRVVQTDVDRSEEKKIKLSDDLKDEEGRACDESNALVLPSKKRKTKVKAENSTIIHKLSKKERKRLEKIVEKKKKKEMRSNILESLQKVQASKEEMSLMTSVAQMQSGAQKRKLEFEETAEGKIKINTVTGSNKKCKHTKAEENQEKASDMESSGESSDGDSEEDTDEEQQDEAASLSVQKTLTPAARATDDMKKNEDTADHQQGKATAKAEAANKGRRRIPSESKPAVHIPLSRKPEMQEARLRLPILGEEQVIMEVISDNHVVVLCGETGSGKTTQVPQFLYEAGYAHGSGIIGVTEPRRVAAISMSKRVAEEMNLSTREVSFQIRYEGNVTKDTRVKFMTDGVLLKEVQKDFLLTKYSVIIVDEAHERSVYTDILLGLLSRIVPLRAKKGIPLKLVIMSATLRVEDFTENDRLFPSPPPVIQVQSRQFPVTIHFNKRTPLDDYLGEAYRKVCKIHRQLPEGGVLVFVTGQQEVHTLCSKLRRTFPFSTGEKSQSDREGSKGSRLPKFNLDDYSVLPLDEEAELDADSPSDEDGEEDVAMEDDPELMGAVSGSGSEEPMHILPLYSLLASDKQAKVFEPPPGGSRLVVIATNVAETSLTIPNIKYVVDCGKVKSKFYDKVTGVSTFKVTWTSKASASQRAGRAGRTGPGHCYRLYSSAVFGDFVQFSEPEITRRPVDDLVLQMKDIGIDKVVNFPFPTPPKAEALKAAESLLESLGALEKPAKLPVAAESKKETSSKISQLGKTMACFPVSPRYGKMLCLGHQHGLLPYVVAIVSALSVDELFVEITAPGESTGEKAELKQQKQKMLQTRKTWAGSGHSAKLGDLMVLLKAVGACEYAGCTPAFCDRHGIRIKAMQEVRKLRAQLTNAVNSVIPDANLILDPKMAPPSDLQAKLLRQIVLAGLGDHVARKIPESSSKTEEAKKMKYAYQSMCLEDPVFIHPSSVLFKETPEYVVYQHISETSKVYIKGVSVVEGDWLPVFVPNQCQFSKPEEDPPPRFHSQSGTIVCHRSSTFGPCSWPLPPVEVEHPPGLDKYRWFGRFLLEGCVCPKLKKYAPSLLTAPVAMVKSWSKLQPRTESLLKMLISQEVDSREKLHTAWKKNPKYLLKTYSAWLPQSLHSKVEDTWPPL